MLERLIERASPGLKSAISYWLSLRSGAVPLPARSAFDPNQISYLLPRVALCEIEHEPAVRTKIRLAGDVLRERAEHRLSGRYVDEAYPNRGPEMDSMLEMVAKGNVAWHRGRSISDAFRRYRYSEVVMLPFSAGGGVVDHSIWVVQVHYEPRADEFLYEPASTQQR
jgi:hypothetical protein